MKNKSFQFIFSTFYNNSKVKHLTDLSIDASAYVNREGKVSDVRVLKINHCARGERFASDIKEFVTVYAPELHTNIYNAAEQHAEKLFTPQKEMA